MFLWTRKGLERTIITGKVSGKRGRPPTSWLKDIKSSTGMRVDTARYCESSRGQGEMAKNRENHRLSFRCDGLII